MEGEFQKDTSEEPKKTPTSIDNFMSYKDIQKELEVPKWIDAYGWIVMKDPFFGLKVRQQKMNQLLQYYQLMKVVEKGVPLESVTEPVTKEETVEQPAPVPGEGQGMFPVGATIQKPTGRKIETGERKLNLSKLFQLPPQQVGEVAEAFGKVQTATEPKMQAFQPGQPIYQKGKGWLTAPGEKEQQKTEIIKNYEYAKSQGYQGTLQDWMVERTTPKTPPSAGNAVDLAIKRKFGTEFLTDPKKVTEADKWLNTPEGRKGVQQARDDLTPPAIAVVQTGEGIKTIETRGTQRGKITPTGELPPMSEDLKKDYTATAQAYDLVNELRTQWNSFEHGKGTTGRAEAVKTYLAATAGQHPNAKVYVANREAFLGNLSRSLAAERGVLTQQDIERIAKALPKIGLNAFSNDNEEEANKKWETIDTIIGNAEKRLTERAGMRKGEMKPITKKKRTIRLSSGKEIQVED